MGAEGWNEFSVKYHNITIVHLRKIRRSNTVPSVLKLQAGTELIRLKQSNLKTKSPCCSFNKGILDRKAIAGAARVAHLYAENSIVDSTCYYFNKIMNQENTPLILTSRLSWQLAKLLVKEKKCDIAKNQIAEIVPNHLCVLKVKSKT